MCERILKKREGISKPQMFIMASVFQDSGLFKVLANKCQQLVVFIRQAYTNLFVFDYLFFVLA